MIEIRPGLQRPVVTLDHLALKPVEHAFDQLFRTRSAPELRDRLVNVGQRAPELFRKRP